MSLSHTNWNTCSKGRIMQMLCSFTSCKRTDSPSFTPARFEDKRSFPFLLKKLLKELTQSIMPDSSFSAVYPSAKTSQRMAALEGKRKATSTGTLHRREDCISCRRPAKKANWDAKKTGSASRLTLPPLPDGQKAGRSRLKWASKL